MTPKLIPLKLLSNGQDTLSFLTKTKGRAPMSWLSRSIFKDGLLNPLIVTQQGNKFSVVDGKKRLAVIRQMAKLKRMPKAMAKVPCIVQEVDGLKPVKRRRPILLTGPELAHQIILASQNATSHAEIAQRFESDISVVEDCLSLRGLHPEILLYFNNKALTLEQAAAFATIENMTAQLDLLHQLGPFVSDKTIISAIRSGATVVELSEDNIIFLPSRGRPDNQNAQRPFEFGKSGSNAARSDEQMAA